MKMLFCLLLVVVLGGCGVQQQSRVEGGSFQRQDQFENKTTYPEAQPKRRLRIIVEPSSTQSTSGLVAPSYCSTSAENETQTSDVLEKLSFALQHARPGTRFVIEDDTFSELPPSGQETRKTTSIFSKEQTLSGDKASGESGGIDENGAIGGGSFRLSRVLEERSYKPWWVVGCLFLAGISALVFKDYVVCGMFVGVGVLGLLPSVTLSLIAVFAVLVFGGTIFYTVYKHKSLKDVLQKVDQTAAKLALAEPKNALAVLDEHLDAKEQSRLPKTVATAQVTKVTG